MKKIVIAVVLVAVCVFGASAGAFLASQREPATMEVVEVVNEWTEPVEVFGKTPEGIGTLFIDEDGNLWQIDNYYAEPTDTFIGCFADGVLMDVIVAE